jgi:hypothetical protein
MGADPFIERIDGFMETCRSRGLLDSALSNSFYRWIKKNMLFSTGLMWAKIINPKLFIGLEYFIF